MRASISTCDECGEGSELGDGLCWDCNYSLQHRAAFDTIYRLDLQQSVLKVLRQSGPLSRMALSKALREHGIGFKQERLWAALRDLETDGYIISTDAGLAEPLEAFRFDSQVEIDFWTAYRRMRPWPLRGLLPNQSAGHYRIDFAINRRKFGIEIDGLAYHNGQDSFMRDRKRQRDLEIEGWRIVRFAAKEIMNDVDACVQEAADQAQTLVIA